jgi:mRNA-degrading endonuclease toxin of MazEF toxin-antitoxin module
MLEPGSVWHRDFRRRQGMQAGGSRPVLDVRASPGIFALYLYIVLGIDS